MDVRTPEPPTSHGQVSFFIQPLSNGIKAHAFLSMFRDGLIEEQLIVGVVIAREGRGTVSDGKVEGYVCGEKLPTAPYKRYRGMSLKLYWELFLNFSLQIKLL